MKKEAEFISSKRFSLTSSIEPFNLCSWAGMVPGNNESAGKKKSGKTRKGNKKLRAAHSAARTKNTYLSSQYQRY